MSQVGSLVAFCGKMGSGKSTMARALAGERSSVLISEDDWLASLYPDEITSFDDYIAYSRRLKTVLGPHVSHLLSLGTSVVLDFPGNTQRQRRWFMEICQGRYPLKVVYLEASDALCLHRLKLRAEQQPERAVFDTPEVFAQVTRYFEEPSQTEGFELERVVQRE